MTIRRLAEVDHGCEAKRLWEKPYFMEADEEKDDIDKIIEA